MSTPNNCPPKYKLIDRVWSVARAWACAHIRAYHSYQIMAEGIGSHDHGSHDHGSTDLTEYCRRLPKVVREKKFAQLS